MSQAHETVVQEPSFRDATAELRQVTSSLWRYVSIYDYDWPFGGTNEPSLQSVTSSICGRAQAKPMAPATRRKRLERILMERFDMVYVENIILRENEQVQIWFGKA